jgi:hypothetical protein
LVDISLLPDVYPVRCGSYLLYLHVVANTKPCARPVPLLPSSQHTVYSIATITMSTEIQPPSPQEITNSSRLPFVNGIEKQGRAPPVAFETQASRRRHGRSSSLSTVFSKLLPSHRSEKGHTLCKTRDNQVELKGTHNYCKRSTYPVQLVPETPVLENKTRSQSSRTHHEVCEQQKSGAIKRLFGSIKPMGKSKDEGVRESKNHERKRVNSQMEQDHSWQPVRAQKAALKNITKYSDEKEITKTQQMFENKKARREQRRSLIESGDFLGVQGANPRTGYWDISDATSSSEPSQSSSEAHKMLAKQAHEVADKKRRYEQAQLEMQIELQRAQALRDAKKKDKLEQKRREMRMRQKGKWRLSENGWSSVAEPDLSPIEQSLAGTPVAGMYH